MKLLPAVLLALLLAFGVESRRWEFCELAQHLHCQHGFSIGELPDWMCLVDSESSFDQGAMNTNNVDGSTDWGLFQINDRYWCNGHYGSSKNECRIDCPAFLNRDPDLSKSVQCARKIFKVHGFSAWVGWRNKCQHNKPVARVQGCFK